MLAFADDKATCTQKEVGGKNSKCSFWFWLMLQILQLKAEHLVSSPVVKSNINMLRTVLLAAFLT